MSIIFKRIETDEVDMSIYMDGLFHESWLKCHFAFVYMYVRSSSVTIDSRYITTDVIADAHLRWAVSFGNIGRWINELVLLFVRFSRTSAVSTQQTRPVKTPAMDVTASLHILLTRGLRCQQSCGLLKKMKKVNKPPLFPRLQLLILRSSAT